jgi:hypothetical protein
MATALPSSHLPKPATWRVLPFFSPPRAATWQVLSFFASLESQYQQVPYHNVEHATDVTHAFHWLITTDAL